MRCIFTLVVLFFFGVISHAQSMQPDYAEGWISLKVNPELRESCFSDRIEVTELKQIFDRLGVDLIQKRFPHAEPHITPRAFIPDTKDKRVDLSLIYKVHYTSQNDPIKSSKLLMNTGMVVYAEPIYIDKPLVIPNDPLLATMWHLEAINAFEGWDIDTGSADVTIAIVDTGVDWDHPDLADAIKLNVAELNGIEGFDDDNNGYTDDIRGWNFYNDNNDPNETGFSHGTHVAGLAGAVPNNAIGVAGTAWACKILPVKVGDKLSIPFGYEGVVYAADNGADVINCSWGGFSPTETGYDVMKYATYNKDALVLGGAGNDNRETRFYPASFREVMSIGATDTTNQKADFSNYNYEIDLIAPGAFIYSLKNDEFGYDSGTSMAAPITAGVAALVRNKFPTLSALQVMEQLKSTADKSIYNIGFNQPYEGKLGAGLLDMKKALEGINTPGLRLIEFELTDGDDDIFSEGDEVYFGVELFNYLNSLTNVDVQITSLSPNVEVVNGSWNIPSIPTSSGLDNYDEPFALKVISTNEYDQKITLKLIASSTATNYVYEQYFDFQINPSYVNVQVNRLRTTISKNGLFGYTDYFQTNGLGFQIDSFQSVIFEGGLLIGHQTDNLTQVVDRVRSDELFDRDFWEEAIISRQVPDGEQAYHAEGSFTDTSANKDEIGLLVEQRVWAFDKEGHQNYIILEYTIENVSEQDLTNVAVGLFADWDIVDAGENKAEVAYGKRLGYVYHTGDKEITAGIQALSRYVFNSYMIDNVSGGKGGVDLFDEEGFTTGDKFVALTNERLNAGAEGNGNDVIEVTSVKEITLPRNAKISVAFALHAGQNIQEVLNSADSAYQEFYGYLPGQNIEDPFVINKVWPNPTSDNATLAVDVRDQTTLSVEVINPMGRFIYSGETALLYSGYNELDLNLSKLQSGVYFVRLSKDDFSQIFPITVQPQ